MSLLKSRKFKYSTVLFLFLVTILIGSRAHASGSCELVFNTVSKSVLDMADGKRLEYSPSFSEIQKYKPFEQCGGTCYLETSLQVFEKLANQASKVPVGVSRVHYHAKQWRKAVDYRYLGQLDLLTFVDNRMSYKKDRSNLNLRDKFMGFLEPLAGGALMSTMIDFNENPYLLMGRSGELPKYVKLAITPKKNEMDIKFENQMVELMMHDLNGVIATSLLKAGVRARKEMDRNFKEIDKIIRTVIAHPKYGELGKNERRNIEVYFKSVQNKKSYRERYDLLDSILFHFQKNEKLGYNFLLNPIVNFLFELNGMEGKLMNMREEFESLADREISIVTKDYVRQAELYWQARKLDLGALTKYRKIRERILMIEHEVEQLKMTTEPIGQRVDRLLSEGKSLYLSYYHKKRNIHLSNFSNAITRIELEQNSAIELAEGSAEAGKHGSHIVGVLKAEGGMVEYLVIQGTYGVKFGELHLISVDYLKENIIELASLEAIKFTRP